MYGGRTLWLLQLQPLLEATATATFLTWHSSSAGVKEPGAIMTGVTQPSSEVMGTWGQGSSNRCAHGYGSTPLHTVSPACTDQGVARRGGERLLPTQPLLGLLRCTGPTLFASLLAVPAHPPKPSTPAGISPVAFPRPARLAALINAVCSGQHQYSHHAAGFQGRCSCKPQPILASRRIPFGFHPASRSWSRAMLHLTRTPQPRPAPPMPRAP